MWTALGLMFMALVLLIIPSTRKNENILVLSCISIFFGTWADKGLGLITGGFVPSPLHHVVDYVPTIPELVISLGIYGIGIFILTILIKIAVTVKEEMEPNL